MFRQKTKLELIENDAQQAARLRHALFVIHGLDDIEQIRRIAQAAMAGEKHGHEIEERKPHWLERSFPPGPWGY